MSTGQTGQKQAKIRPNMGKSKKNWKMFFPIELKLGTETLRGKI